VGWGRESARERARERERGPRARVLRGARTGGGGGQVYWYLIGTLELPSSVQGEGEAKRRNEAEEVQVVW
jgi:hypothetical protein